MRKKSIWMISAWVYGLLALCTLASIQVQRLILPQVQTAEAGPGTVRAEEEERPYNYTIPFSALERDGDDYAVYYLQEREGRFGREKYVLRMGVRVVDQDGVTAALASQGYGEIVVGVDKPLRDGDRVLVIREK